MTAKNQVIDQVNVIHLYLYLYLEIPNVLKRTPKEEFYWFG